MARGSDAPEPLAELLARYLKGRGMEGRLRQTAVLDQWGTLVGPEIGAVTRAVSIGDDATLVVAVKSPAWMSELRMMERELLGTINAATVERPLLRIRWTLMR